MILVLVVGNSGPTVAKDVRVTFSPSLAESMPDELREKVALMERYLCEGAGLRSITPERVFTWSVGPGHKILSPSRELPEVLVTVTGQGPSGPLEPLTYWLALKDLQHQQARATGPALLVDPLKEIAKALKTDS